MRVGFGDVVRSDQPRQRIAHRLIASELAVVRIVAGNMVFDVGGEDEGAQRIGDRLTVENEILAGQSPGNAIFR